MLVDYLIPKVYIFDCFLLIKLIIFLSNKKNYQIFKKNKIKLKKIDTIILIFLSIFFINLLLQLNLNLIIFCLRIILIIFFIFSPYLDQKKQKLVYKALSLSIIWQSFLAYFQFIKQTPLAPYYIFGETNLRHFAAISRAQFLTIEKILPYGSTAHPNILAGIIGIFSILLIDKKQNNKLLVILLLLNAFAICLITQSLSAFLTLCLFLIYLLIKKINWQKKINLIVFSFFILSPLLIKKLDANLLKTHLSISRRAILNEAAWKMFLDKTFFGVGANNFVKELENYSHHQETVRFVQPAHHLGLLLLSEGGLLFSSILLLLGIKFKKKINWSKLLILTPIASLDHYLITQALGLFTLFLFIFLTRNRGQSRT